MTDRSVMVRIKGDVSDYNRKLLQAAAGTKAFTKELDTSTDRATNLTQSLLAIGPALVPLSAAAIPAVSGLTNQLAFAATGAGVAALAFSGVGDALKATNDYAVEPTQANFEKMHQSLAELGPAGREFVGFLQELRPQLQTLQDAAQEGLFPGAEAGLRDLLDLLPQAERIVSTVSSTLGDLMAEAGDNLNDPRWRDFFTFLETEARPTLMDMGRTLGNFVEGFANLWMAFDPLSDNFSRSFLQLSRDFANWTDGLSETKGFQEFVDYIERVGPKAWETLGALGNALTQIVEAAAPIGEASLPILTALADTLAMVADSPVGPVLIGAAAGISALSRAVALYNVANGAALTGMMDKLGGKGAVFRGAAAGASIMALSMTQLDEKIGLSNTASLALAGSLAGPWGAAVGAGVGLVKDFAAANDSVWEAVNRANASMSDGSASYADQLEAIDAAIAAIDDYKSSLDDVSLTGFLRADKDAIEGLFGKSDVEEGAEARDKLLRQREDIAASAQQQKFAEAGLSDALLGTSDAARDQVEAMLDLINVRNQATSQALQARDAERALQEAIDNAADSARENGRNFDVNTPKGRANEEALDAIAAAWNNLDAEQQNASGKAESVEKQFIETAISMGRSRAAAERLANQLLEMPTNVTTDVRLDGAGAATRAARNLRAALLAIPGLTTTTIRTIEETFIVPKKRTDRNSPDVEAFRASGGYVSGPGTTTSDSIPAWLSNKEYVIKASSVEKYGVGMLDAINAGHFANGGLVQRFAAGGPVQATRFADGGHTGGVAVAAPTGPQAVRIKSGALKFDRSGHAFIEGIAELVYDTRKNHENRGGRARLNGA